MKLLSKLFIASFLGSIFLAGCETEEDNFFQSTQITPILSVNVPDTMSLGETYTLGITYEKSSDCHELLNFEAVNEGDSLYYVRAISIFTEAANCNLEPEGVLKEVDYTNNFESNFKFKFLNGIDSLGEFTYIDKDVIVNE